MILVNGTNPMHESNLGASVKFDENVMKYV